MLQHGLAKFSAKKIQPVEADALHLPLADSSMDLVVSSFGFRNLANYDAGLREIFRVLKPQGEVGILDFSEPGGMLGKLYGFYFRKVLPRIGTLISGVRGPYEYLPASVHKFPAPQEMLARMESVGFKDVSWTPYTFAIAGLYRGKKALSHYRAGDNILRPLRGEAGLPYLHGNLGPVVDAVQHGLRERLAL